MRRCVDDPLVLGLIPASPSWDVPHRLLAAVDWLVLGGEAEDYRGASDPWECFREVLVSRADWVAGFVREQGIQTNEVQRCFALLPLFLTVARAACRPLDLIELGASAGLNLLWDRYRYRYAAGAWGPSGAMLELTGEERAPVPADLFGTAVEIRGRRGIDLAPVDASSDTGVRLLLSFTPEQARRDRLLRAIDVLRDDPPELIQADYLELLPRLLAERGEDTLTVVFQTLSTVYLERPGRERLRRIVEEAGVEGPLAWISTPTPDEHGLLARQYPLELALWPGGERRIVAEMANGGEWLEWWGV